MCKLMQTIDEARISPAPFLRPEYSMKSPTLRGTMARGSCGVNVWPEGRLELEHFAVFPEYGMHMGKPEKDDTEGLAVSAIQYF